MRPLLALILASLALGGCRTTQPFVLSHVDSLRTSEPAEIAFDGLEFLADSVPGSLKPRVNIVYMHGIGWTEDPEGDPLAVDFLDGLARAYGVEAQVEAQTTCLDAGAGPVAPGPDVLYITADAPLTLSTALPGATLGLDRIACVDRQVLDVSDTLEFAVYRVFWDDIFWNALQFQHVGQDDDRGSSSQIARERRKYNRRLKDELVSYGLSDAVLYLGPMGATVRDAVRGSICAAHLDAGGYGFAEQGLETSHAEACRLAGATRVETNAFAFVSESLGSKIAYDLFRDALTDGRDGPLDRLVEGSEIYMLANQIALLSLSDVTTEERPRALEMTEDQRPTVVAVSEVNDFLTFELVPFLRQLWSRSDGGTDFDADFDANGRRAELAASLGFDVVDLRVEFADPLVPGVRGLVDPLQAHKDHAAERELMRLILCGMRGGELRAQGCLAARDRDNDDE